MSSLERAERSFNAGNAYLRTGDIEAAIKAYDVAIGIDPTFASAYYNRALALFEIGNDVGGVADLCMAAVAGYDEDFFYDAWARHVIEYAGYRGVLDLCDDRRFRQRQRHRLERSLIQYLESSSYLLRSFPETGIRFDAASLPARCLAADLLRTRLDPDFELVLLLHELAEQGPPADPEIAWRVSYLLGSVFASSYVDVLEALPDQFGLFFDADFFENEAFLLDLDGEAGDALDELVLRLHPDWKGLDRRVRFARYALQRFDEAATSLCTTRAFRLTPGGSPELQWGVTQDVWRLFVQTTLFLGDARAYSRATGLARRFNGLVSVTAWTVDSSFTTELKAHVEEVFTEVDPVSVTGSLEPGNTIVDLFAFEMATDTVAHATWTGGRGMLGTEQVHPNDVVTLAELNRFGQSSTADGTLTAELEAEYAQLLTHDSPGLLRRVLDPTLFEATRLLIIPYGYLHNLAVHALPSVRAAALTGSLKEVVYVPSFAWLGLRDRREPVDRSSARLLFVGGGEGISYETEAARLTGIFTDAEVLTGDEATRDAVLDALPHASVVHFACHGGFDRERNSGYLQLPEDRLYPSDLLELDGLHIDLVFLNACVTGVVARVARNGDVAMGLPSALLMLGARQVIGSLWEIDDSVALELASRFFRRWRDQPGTSAAQMLFELQRDLSREPEFRSPLLWGAHAVFGDWR